MQSLVYILLLAAVCGIVSLMIRKQPAFLQRISTIFTRWIQQFESWQMLR